MKHIINVALIPALCLMAASATSHGQLKMNEAKAGKGDKVLPYRWIETGQGKHPALILFLHGMGERGADNLRQTRHGIPELLAWLKKERKHCIVIAPQCPQDAVWSNLNGGFKGADQLSIKKMPSYPMKLVFDVVDGMVIRHQVDRARIYITGLSMGGYGTFDALARRPDFFAAAMPVCGGGDRKTADRFKHVPIWVFHGAADKVVPAQMSRTMVDALKSAGGSPKYTEYPKVGHDAWSPTYANPAVWRWLFSQAQ